MGETPRALVQSGGGRTAADRMDWVDSKYPARNRPGGVRAWPMRSAVTSPCATHYSTCARSVDIDILMIVAAVGAAALGAWAEAHRRSEQTLGL